MNPSAPSFVPPPTSSSTSGAHPFAGKHLQTQEEHHAVTGRGGGRKGKQKHQQANHLAAFHSDKLRQNHEQGNHHHNQDHSRQQHNKSHSHSYSHSHKKQHTRVPTTSSHSKEHFLATNYKYVVSSYANFHQPGFFDPDSLVSWDDIQLVIATLDSNDAYESCAICREDTLVLPQLTQCGHIFCLTCLLRYLETDYSKKCPVCNRCNVTRADLREVIFVATPPPLVTSRAIFSLLSKDKASLFPNCHDTTSESLLSCPDLQALLINKKGEKAQFTDESFSESAAAAAVGVPEIDSQDSQYTRICYASPKKLIRFINQSLKTLETFRKLCLSSASTTGASESRGDVEYLPILPEAIVLLTTRKEYIKTQAQAQTIQQVASQKQELKAGTGAEARKRKEGLARGMAMAMPGRTDVSPSSSLWLYQQQAGHLSFLHPLCMRALLYEQTQTQTLTQIQIQTQTQTQTQGETVHISVVKEEEGEGEGHISLEDIQLSATSTPSVTSHPPSPLSSLPVQVSGSVLEIDHCTVTPEQRKRYPFIRHLPLDCPFSLVEIDMSASLSSATFEHFRSQFQQRETARKNKRQKLLKAERQEQQREESKQKQVVQQRRELFRHQEEAKQQAIQSLLTSPPVGQKQEQEQEGEGGGEGEEEGGGGVHLQSPAPSTEETPTAPSAARSNNSFANITQMGVSNNEAFPTLGAGAVAGTGGEGGGGGNHPSSSSSSAWGARHSKSTNANTYTNTNMINIKEAHCSTGVSSDSSTAAAAAKKKGKGKGKFVASSSLFATSSGSRSYR